MDKKLVESFVEVWETLLPEKTVMETFPIEAQERLYQLCFFIVGLLVGSRLSSVQIVKLLEVLPKTKIQKKTKTPTETTEAPQEPPVPSRPGAGKLSV